MSGRHRASSGRAQRSPSRGAIPTRTPLGGHACASVSIYCHGQWSADVPVALHAVVFHGSGIMDREGSGGRWEEERGRRAGLTSSSFCLSSATMVSLTTHRCSSRSSIMYSWFSRSMATMMDLTAGSASIRTPAWGAWRPSGVSGERLAEVGGEASGGGCLRTSDSSGHGFVGGPGSWAGRAVRGEAAGGLYRGLGAPAEIVVGGGVRVLTIASMGNGMMYPGKSSLSLSRAGARQQVSELLSPPRWVGAFYALG